MMRSLLVCCLAMFVAFATLRADEGAAGNWRVEFVTPQGQVGLNMTINQAGTKLTGRVTDEYGEWPIEGRLAGDQVTVSWSIPEEGKMLQITMKGKLENGIITGTARLGDVGEGPLRARRVSVN